MYEEEKKKRKDKKSRWKDIKISTNERFRRAKDMILGSWSCYRSLSVFRDEIIRSKFLETFFYMRFYYLLNSSCVILRGSCHFFLTYRECKRLFYHCQSPYGHTNWVTAEGTTFENNWNINASPSIFTITINNSGHAIFEYRSDPCSHEHYWTSSWIEFFKLACIGLMFFKPYFNYWFSSVHNCEDGFKNRFFNCTNMIFHIFIVITQYFCYLRSLYLLFKVWFSLPYVSFQSNWAWKPLKLGLSIRPFKIFLQMTHHEIEANRKIKIVRLWLVFMFLIWPLSAVSDNKILTVKAFWSCNGKWRSTS